MKTNQAGLFRKKWYILDQSVIGLAMNPMESFAIDDTLCRLVANEPDWGIARTWVHGKTIVLGIQDYRLPHIEEGIAFLKEKGYEVIVRNSGGLAVVLDEEVLNLSIIFADERSLSIDRGYELMVELVRELIGELAPSIVDGEIKESYCPGRYDLSIDGKKFAGISQRRLRGGVAIQIYLAVSGSGSQRATLIRDFYEKAVQGKPTKYHYPKIVPSKMASLEELAPQMGFTVEKLQSNLLFRLASLSNVLENYKLPEDGWEIFQENLVRMRKRNEKLLTEDSF